MATNREELNHPDMKPSVFFGWLITSEIQRPVALVCGILNFWSSSSLPPAFFCGISSSKCEDISYMKMALRLRQGLREGGWKIGLQKKKLMGMNKDLVAKC